MCVCVRELATWHSAKRRAHWFASGLHWVAMVVVRLLQWFAHWFIAEPCVEPVPRAATARRPKKEREKIFKLSSDMKY